jgi:hypothetical protein
VESKGAMKRVKWVLLAVGLVGAMVLAVVLVNGWLNRRKRAIRKAGSLLGLTALAPGEQIMVPLVPLIDRPGRKYLAVLTGIIYGCQGGFFDLFVSSGENWNLQSAVLLRDSGSSMPQFQLRTKQWSMISQRVRGRSVDVPGREHEMNRIKLTSENPEWVRTVFSNASRGFLEKVQAGRWTIEGYGNALVIYQWGKRISAGCLKAYVQQAAEIGTEMFSLSKDTEKSPSP